MYGIEFPKVGIINNDTEDCKGTAKKQKFKRIHIGISHEDKQAIAFAIAE